MCRHKKIWYLSHVAKAQACLPKSRTLGHIWLNDPWVRGIKMDITTTATSINFLKKYVYYMEFDINNCSDQDIFEQAILIGYLKNVKHYPELKSKNFSKSDIWEIFG